jgi:hypothetical protein
MSEELRVKIYELRVQQSIDSNIILAVVFLSTGYIVSKR